MSNVTTTFPGVYIDEDASPAVSVSQGATAVPLFIGKFSASDDNYKKIITRVSSWLDFCQKFTVDIALQLYFQNGGGACYIYPLEDATDTACTSGLPDMIDKVGDITLFVVSENDVTYKSTVYGILTPSLTVNKGYFLLADSHDGTPPAGLGDNAHIAVYYPPLIPVSSASSTVSASAVMAGVYCRTDRERGVWKAPANVELAGVSDVSFRVTDDTQSQMNQLGVNAIRYFSDRGVIAWGGRTLKPDDDNWRYIPVRRLFDTAERDIKKAMRAMVFEPNNALTWKRVKIAIENYLHGIWLLGGLAGNKAEEAYSVQIGKDRTMTTDDINQGKMIVQVGMAAVRPAEFIILQFTQDMSQ
ncbi:MULTISPECIES: phage tail sheath family protein [unclassified Serratia (in: enterobacteria)]|uniref:phage tail sheath family protein n=1 Tax=unclassified Serratia (in: enterobacteria) TaxID=2647522 RepID=UPI003B436A4C